MDNQQIRTYHLNLVNSKQKSYKHDENGGLKRKHFRGFIGFFFLPSGKNWLETKLVIKC